MNNILRIVLLGCVMLFSANSYAEMDPLLVGVWRNQDNRNIIHEFSAKGVRTIFLAKRTRFGGIYGQQLTIQSRIKLKTIASGKYEYFFQNKKLIASYVINNNHLSYGDGKGPTTLRYSRIYFKNENKNGSYQLFLNQAFEAELEKAINDVNVEKIKKLFSSPGASFFKRKTQEINGVDKVAQESGVYFIRDRLWRAAVESRNTKIVSIFIKNLPEFLPTNYIALAKKTNDKAMVSLLQNVSNIDKTSMVTKDVVNLQVLLKLDLMMDNPFNYRDKIIQSNCVVAFQNPNYVANNNAQGIKNEKTYAKIETETKNKNEKYVTDYEKILRLCLAVFTNEGRISSQVLNAKTIPGEAGFEQLTTPLYRYSYARGYKEDNILFRYITVKLLLEFGADPSIKPGSDSEPLIKHMYRGVNHEYFQKINTLKKYIDRNKKMLKNPRLHKNNERKI